MPTEFDDGDTIDSNSQGTLILGTTGIAGTAKAIVTDNDGHLQLDVLSSGLPVGAATADNQTNGDQKTQIVDDTGAEMDLWHTGDLFTAAADHGLMVLAVSDEVPNKYRPIRSDGDGRLEVHTVNTAHDEFNFVNEDYDTGGGTETVSMIGLALPASGGAVAAPGDTTNGLDVDVTRSALPTGAATSALQSTLNGYVDGIEGLLTTIDADTGGILTAVQLLDNAVSGNEFQVDVLTQPARVATTDTITAKLATDALQNGTTALTPKFKIIDGATSGDNTLVAAVSGKKIRVLSLAYMASGTVTVRFEDGAGGTALTGQMQHTAQTGMVLPFNPFGHFETSANTLLNMELSAAVSVDGCLTYVEV